MKSRLKSEGLPIVSQSHNDHRIKKCTNRQKVEAFGSKKVMQERGCGGTPDGEETEQTSMIEE